MFMGHQIPGPDGVTVFEAAFGGPVKVEFWLARESETSFWDNQFTSKMIFDTTTEMGKFLLLHPWFCQHIVLVWKESGKTVNIVMKSFQLSIMDSKSLSFVGVEVQPVTNLTACEMIEESRQAIEAYDGTGATELMEKFNERAKQYFLI